MEDSAWKHPELATWKEFASDPVPVLLYERWSCSAAKRLQWFAVGPSSMGAAEELLDMGMLRRRPQALDKPLLVDPANSIDIYQPC